MLVVNIKNILSDHGIDYKSVVNQHGFLFMEAFSDTSYVSLTVNYNQKTQTFDLEHTLPPPYYSLNVVGKRREEVVNIYKKRY